MSDGYDLKICCMGAGYVGGPTMAVIAAKCPKVRHLFVLLCLLESRYMDICMAI